jgi:hypothetical protein
MQLLAHGEMTHSILFLMGLSLLILHEMDDIRCREWRIFPGLSLLNDQIGHIVFLFAHIPLFYWIFWRLSDNANNDEFIKGLDIFFIAHMMLHIVFLKHKNNEFNDWISWTIIIGAGVCGLADLLMNGRL